MAKGGKRNIKTPKKKVDDTDSDENEDNSDNDGNSSNANTSVAADRTDDIEGLSESVEKLSDKRASTREAGLKGILKVLRGTNQSMVDSVSNYNETICSSLGRMLRRPASLKEGSLCLDAYCLLCLLAGPDEGDLFDQFEQFLTKLVNGNSNYEELRVAAIAALAFSSYICSSEAHYRIMTLCEDVLCGESEGEPATPALQARAAASWTLLASINSEEAVLTRCKDRIFEELVELLENGESEVKISAGFSFGVLWDIADSAAPDVDWTISGMELCENPAKVAQAVATLQKMSRESSKRISKKDRKEQRAAFRDVEDWIVDGEKPYESVRMQGAVLECTSFTTLRLLEELREVLGDGFHSSLKVFPVVKDVLGVAHITNDMDGDGKDTNVRKGGATDKLRSGYRKQERRFREINTEFFGDHEDTDY